jgi:hypothetical protein
VALACTPLCWNSLERGRAGGLDLVSACVRPARKQSVCDAGICKAERQKEHARKWWNQNRSKKAHGQTNASRKTGKKGGKGNVARKAR